MSLTHHDGISVYGSGLAIGQKYSEKTIMNNSGFFTSNAIFQYGLWVGNVSTKVQIFDAVGNLTGDINENTSGVYVGPTTSRAQLTNASGVSTSNLQITQFSLAQIFDFGGVQGGARTDGGTFGLSGWYTQVSTKLSSILYAAPSMQYPIGGLTTLASGFTTMVNVAYSGHKIDFFAFTQLSGNSLNNGVTSAGTSSKISWIAIGI